jgi:hypothetical protein
MEEYALSMIENSVNISPVLIGAIAALMLIFAIALVIYHRRYRVNMFWGLLAVLFGGFGLLLAAGGSSAGIIYANPSGDPQSSVSQFFDALISEDYATAYSFMNDHSDLGLANEPETEEAQLIYDALKQSYDYTLVGDCEVNMLTATQRVSMRYLDIGDLTSTLGDLTAAKLKIIVQTRDRSLVYDDNDQYLPEVTQEAYAAALNQALKNVKNSYKQIEFDLTLYYTGGKWQLSTAPELLMALSGGTMS